MATAVILLPCKRYASRIIAATILLSCLIQKIFWHTQQRSALAAFLTLQSSLKKTSSTASLDTDIESQNAAWKKQHFPRFVNGTRHLTVDLLLEYTEEVLNQSSTSVHQHHHHEPTAFYYVDQNFSLWKNTALEFQYASIWKRSRETESLALMSLEYLKIQIDQNVSHAWPALQTAIQQGGFPFLVYYKDFNGCAWNNWRRNGEKLSIPLFTFSVRVDCPNALPWPTHKSIKLAKLSSDDWTKSFQKNIKKYKQVEQIPKAVWRGSLTGTMNKELNESSRWKLCELSVKHPTVLDARLVHIPEWRNISKISSVGKVVPKMDFEDFQRFVAVVDVDGNAWSSRFAALLCMETVVLKVEPEMVEHFYDDLDPWVHFIPVRSDLTDIVQKIGWVLSHPEQAESIGQNANLWCSQKMTIPSLVKDLLYIWDQYIQLLQQEGEWSMGWLEKMNTLRNEMGLISIATIRSKHR